MNSIFPRIAFAASCFSAAAIAAPLQAKLPEPVRKLVDAAIATGDKAKVDMVVALAKQTNPDDATELDAMQQAFLTGKSEEAARLAAEKEAAIRQAGLFENWSGQGEFGAFRSTGNSSNIGLSAGLRLERKGIDWRHKLAARTDYQRSNGLTTREQYLFSYEPNYEFDNRMFLYGLGQYERDRFQGYLSRLTFSGGAGFRLFDTPNLQLAAKAGPAWRHSHLTNGGTESGVTALAALDVDWKLSDRIKLTEDASAYRQPDNSTFVSATGLEAALGSKLSARVSYSVEHDTDPPAGAVQTDTLTRFTVIYGF